jgi:protein-arginine kinase activator protein McsA
VHGCVRVPLTHCMACSAPVQLQSKSENGDMDDLAPEEAMVERLLERLETGIESAVSQERFKEASALRDEISRMHMDDSSAVLKVNSGMQ